MKVIDGFQDRYRFLSNFWAVKIKFEGHVYPSVEHAYQAAKTLDEEKRKEIREARTPGEAKRLGRTVELRPEWEDIRVSLMKKFLWDKFCDPILAGKLLDTGDALLVEGNTWGDTFWGVCKGKGENQLGKLLMNVREELKKPLFALRKP